MDNKRLTRLIALILPLFLFACSGGEGGTGATDGAKGGDISRGQITAFGSIFVNGVEFYTTDSSISLDGVAGVESDLKLGMVVTVTGTIHPDGLTGKADTIASEEVIQGLVQANDNSHTLTVLNHSVELPSNVQFGGVTDISGITAMTDFVQVSGYISSHGVISATRVELVGSNASKSEIFGTVSNLGSAGKDSFQIGPALTVDYSSASLSGFSNGQIREGLYVEVEGSFDPTSGILSADSVEYSPISSSDVEKIQIEGFITSAVSASNFLINDIAVLTDANTEFKGGPADEIVAGNFVEVEGSLHNGILSAREVKFSDGVRIVGEVNNKGSTTFTIAGMTGLTVQTDSLTAYSSGGFKDIKPGNRVRIRGFQHNNSTAVARRIDSIAAGNDASLQGNVSAIISPPPTLTFAINGAIIDTSSISPDTGFIVDGESKNSTEFYSSLNVYEDVVEAKGTLSGNVISWQSVDLKPRITRTGQ